MPDLSAYLSTAGVARQLGVSGETVRYWAKRGRLASLPTANGRLFDQAEVAALQEAQRQRMGQPGGRRAPAEAPQDQEVARVS